MTDFTPGPWAASEDPMCNQSYKTLVVLPSEHPLTETWLALVQHNWNDAEYGERRISWAEAEANACLIAAAPDMLAELKWIAAQYENGDLNHVDFRVGAKHRADAVIAKATGK